MEAKPGVEILQSKILLRTLDAAEIFCYQFGRINKEVYMGDYRYEAPKALTRARNQTIQSLTREKQRFLNQLFLKFSSFTQEKIFSNKFGAAATAILEEFESADELAYMDADELAAFVQKHGNGKFNNVEDIVSDLQKAAKNSYRPPTVIADSVNQILTIFMSTIRLLQGQVKKYDKAIEKQFSTIPNTLTSVKGIGLVYAAGIIAEVGDINRFPSQASLAKYAGLTWTQHQSGDFEADDTHLIKSGNHHLRYRFCCFFLKIFLQSSLDFIPLDLFSNSPLQNTIMLIYLTTKI